MSCAVAIVLVAVRSTRPVSNCCRKATMISPLCHSAPRTTSVMALYRIVDQKMHQNHYDGVVVRSSAATRLTVHSRRRVSLSRRVKHVMRGSRLSRAEKRGGVTRFGHDRDPGSLGGVGLHQRR